MQGIILLCVCRVYTVNELSLGELFDRQMAAEVALANTLARHHYRQILLGNL